ncbi:DNA-binding transcriptional regulator Fis [Bermanella marisrubri]|uniref:Putative Fis-like DNA-binding protein n=1 Tax=Bermanella marisrubri TaxID=207949 RepID=Q1N3K2_9GAMM|nr:DNA-binding transcriptional regulator Fis [Bermanella marisrubri]EAT12872.1 Factor for inversion stimulation Fis, transcriptional activator [Oceanobacter sp. RED65] [Bermanella marisrubri]QIZ83192.1 DNA-binding transcriptional regulator Fis [Bermanella marisrubri]
MSTHEAPELNNPLEQSTVSPAGNTGLSTENTQTLRDSVEQALESYFAQLDGQPVSDVYEMVLSEVEAPLLEVVMRYTRDNQTKASVLLGLNRGTLRKKLKQYGML